MEKRKYQLLILLFGCLAVAYSVYVFVLQPPTFFSRMRLAIAFFIWFVLFIFSYIILWIARKRHFPKIDKKQLISGVAGFFILFNLVLSANLEEIPYTYILLPTKTVTIKPKSDAQSVQLTAFNTELIEGISLGNFEFHDGWTTVNNIITSGNGQNKNLVWRGKPGQFVELTFKSCTKCDGVIVEWGSRNIQEVDLSEAASKKPIRIFYKYPSLLWHQLSNFILLEISVFLLSLALTYLGSWVANKLIVNEEEFEGIRKPLHHFLPVIILFGLTLFVYGLKMTPILHNDDWCRIIEWLNSPASDASMIVGDRPLQWVVPWILNQFLPLHQTVYAIYYSQILVIFVTSISFYVLVNRFLDNRSWFAFLAAGLYLVFPNPDEPEPKRTKGKRESRSIRGVKKHPTQVSNKISQELSQT